MKYLPLLWGSMWRHPFRTVLTLLSIWVAFLLFGLLHGVTTTVDGVIDHFAANRLSVLNSEGRVPLPIAYLSKIGEVPGVSTVAALTYVPGYFGDPKHGTVAYAWSSARGIKDSGEVEISQAYVDAFARTRIGAVADEALAHKHGWRIGDLIPFTSPVRKVDGNNVWTFELVGFYKAPPHSLFSDQLWIHHEYLDEARVLHRGTADTFIVYTTDVSRNDDISAAIDALFSSSSASTTTQIEREWMRAGWSQAIDFHLLTKAILGGAFFTLLLITANTMMESVRQRIPEFGVLRVLGFSDAAVLLLVLSEAILLYALGAALGLTSSKGFFPLIAPVTSGGPIPMPMSVIIQGGLIALAAAMISGAVPAIRAQRLSVVQALRRI
jgi:putative ABC transport system permease protein